MHKYKMYRQIFPGQQVLQQLDIIQQQVVTVHLQRGETQKPLEIGLQQWGINQSQMEIILLQWGIVARQTDILL